MHLLRSYATTEKTQLKIDVDGLKLIPQSAGSSYCAYHKAAKAGFLNIGILTFRTTVLRPSSVLGGGLFKHRYFNI